MLNFLLICKNLSLCMYVKVNMYIYHKRFSYDNINYTSLHSSLFPPVWSHTFDVCSSKWAQ